MARGDDITGCRPTARPVPAWLPNGGSSHEADERDVGGAAGLQGDRVHAEVLEHVEDGLEPQVLHSTLTVLIQREAEVLGFSLEVEGEDVFSAPRLALTDQKDAVARRASSQH